MFELSVACKYLIPRWRQLSVSIISLISMLVIALVVWLIVVFFSVKDGLENSWIEKLVALTAPIRISPTDHYYQSYYYLVDGISSKSDYTLKTIQEKYLTDSTDPYDPDTDEEPPSDWLEQDLEQDGTLRDIVKETYHSLDNLKLNHREYEITAGNLVLQLVKGNKDSYIEYSSYISSYDPENHAIAKTLIFPEEDFILPKDGIIIPKNFMESGVAKGDKGYISYYTPTASSMQEQRIPIVVSDFYDPGIMSIGGKFILANREITSLIRSSSPPTESHLTNGINVHIANLKDADKIKQNIIEALRKEKLEPYWNVKTYKEFDFAKDLLQQLRSEKNIFSLISAVMIIVACSNIISMLIILVNDKKIEIGILRSMGASSFSIAAIFGLCGMVMGAMGSFIGVIAAILTLNNLEQLVNYISQLQGYDLFNPVFFGDILPNDVSFEVLSFVVFATAIVSLFAGIVPAFKACLIQPSVILRSE